MQQRVSTLACLVTPSAQNETARNPPVPELQRACWNRAAAPALVLLVTRRLEVRQAYWGSGAQVLARLEAYLAFKERPILDQRSKDSLEHALLQPAAHIRVCVLDWHETSRERSRPARNKEWGQQQRPPLGSGALEAAEVQRRPAPGGKVSPLWQSGAAETFARSPPRCEQSAPSPPLSTHVALDVLFLCTAHLHTAQHCDL